MRRKPTSEQGMPEAVVIAGPEKTKSNEELTASVDQFSTLLKQLESEVSEDNLEAYKQEVKLLLTPLDGVSEVDRGQRDDRIKKFVGDIQGALGKSKLGEVENNLLDEIQMGIGQLQFNKIAHAAAQLDHWAGMKDKTYTSKQDKKFKDIATKLKAYRKKALKDVTKNFIDTFAGDKTKIKDAMQNHKISDKDKAEVDLLLANISEGPANVAEGEEGSLVTKFEGLTSVIDKIREGIADDAVEDYNKKIKNVVKIMRDSIKSKPAVLEGETSDDKEDNVEVKQPEVSEVDRGQRDKRIKKFVEDIQGALGKSKLGEVENNLLDEIQMGIGQLQFNKIAHAAAQLDHWAGMKDKTYTSKQDKKFKDIATKLKAYREKALKDVAVGFVDTYNVQEGNIDDVANGGLAAMKRQGLSLEDARAALIANIPESSVSS